MIRMHQKVDIIYTVTKAYLFALKTRHDWWRWMLLPFILTLVTRLSAHFYNLDALPFWLAIIALPQFFLQGWLSAKLVRFHVFGEAGKVPEDRSALENLTAGILFYVLISFFSSALFGSVMLFDMVALADRQDPLIFTAFLFGTVFVMWAIRYAWLFAVASIGYPVSKFLKKIHGWRASLQIFVIIIFCNIPVYFVLFTLITIFESFGVSFTDLEGSQGVLLIVLSVMADIVVMSFTTFAASLFVQQIVREDNEKTRQKI